MKPQNTYIPMELITHKHIEVMEEHRSNMIEFMNTVRLSQRNKERFFFEITQVSKWLNNFKIII